MAIPQRVYPLSINIAMLIIQTQTNTPRGWYTSLNCDTHQSLGVVKARESTCHHNNSRFHTLMMTHTLWTNDDAHSVWPHDYYDSYTYMRNSADVEFYDVGNAGIWKASLGNSPLNWIIVYRFWLPEAFTVKSWANITADKICVWFISPVVV